MQISPICATVVLTCSESIAYTLPQRTVLESCGAVRMFAYTIVRRSLEAVGRTRADSKTGATRSILRGDAAAFDVWVRTQMSLLMDGRLPGGTVFAR